MSADTVRKLYITLRRSFAGTRETQRKTLETLGFKYREQTVVRDNTESVRGAISKVRKSEAHCTPMLMHMHLRFSSVLLNMLMTPSTTIQVKHLVSVETDQAFEARRAAEAAALAMRPPVRILHSDMTKG